jgi:uncharacterized protein
MERRLMTDVLNKTERTRLRRARERGHFERDTIYSILDAMPMCHIGYMQQNSPVVMPTIQWREGDHIYWHASSGGRGVKAWLEGEVCITVTLLDGLVLARSALHHSVNFRSVLIFGQPTLITDYDEKYKKLNGLIDHLYPGRSSSLRTMTDAEVKQTAVLSLPIEEASAKIRNTGVVDEEEDYGQAVWSGVIPVTMQLMEPEPDDRNLEGIEIPEYVHELSIG